MGDGGALLGVHLDCVLLAMLLVLTHDTGASALMCSRCDDCLVAIDRSHTCGSHRAAQCYASIDLGPGPDTRDAVLPSQWQLSRLGCHGDGAPGPQAQCDIVLNSSATGTGNSLSCTGAGCAGGGGPLPAVTAQALERGLVQVRICCTGNDHCNERLAVEVLALRNVISSILVNIKQRESPTVLIKEDSSISVKSLYISLGAVSAALIILVLIFTVYIWVDGHRRRPRHHRRNRVERKPSAAASDRVVVRPRSMSRDGLPEAPVPLRTHLCTHNQCTSRQSSYRRSVAGADRSSKLLSTPHDEDVWGPDRSDSCGSGSQSQVPANALAAHSDASQRAMPQSSASLQYRSSAPTYAEHNGWASASNQLASPPPPPPPLPLQPPPPPPQVSTIALTRSTTQPPVPTPTPALATVLTDDAYTPSGRSTAETMSNGVPNERRAASLSRKRAPPSHRLTRDMNGLAVPVRMSLLAVHAHDSDNGLPFSGSGSVGEHEHKPSTVSETLHRLGFDYIPSLEQVCRLQRNGCNTSSPELELSDCVSESDHPATNPTYSVSTFSDRANGNGPAAPTGIERKRKKRTVAEPVTVV